MHRPHTRLSANWLILVLIARKVPTSFRLPRAEAPKPQVSEGHVALITITQDRTRRLP